MDAIAGEIIEYIHRNRALSGLEGRRLHLGVFSEPCLSRMLDGRKKIESRITKNKVPPYQRMTKDDIVFVKRSGGNIIGYLELDAVLFIDLSVISISEIKERYADGICAEERFWQSKAGSRYATLMFIRDFHKITPFSVTKKDMRTWMVLGQGQNS
jgi:hypothetical protein